MYSDVLHVALQLKLGWIIFVHVPSERWRKWWLASVFSELSLESCTCALPLQYLDSCLQPYHFPPSLKQIIAPLLKTVKSALITFFSFPEAHFGAILAKAFIDWVRRWLWWETVTYWKKVKSWQVSVGRPADGWSPAVAAPSGLSSLKRRGSGIRYNWWPLTRSAWLN